MTMDPPNTVLSLPLRQRRRQRRQWRPTTLLLLLLSKPFLASSYLCDFLIEDTWQSLAERIATSSDQGFVMLCPFSIHGDGCPPASEKGAYVVPSGRDLYLMCEPYYSLLLVDDQSGGASSCTIDCPGSQFIVEAHGSLTLDSITIRGSESSAIQVQPNASLDVFNSHFEGNTNHRSNGGAIFAAEGSDVYLSQTSFVNNSALSGGAVYSLGNTQIHNADFVGNVATSKENDRGGGAVYLGELSSASVTRSDFFNNVAASFGPAILDRTSGNFSSQSNTGCNNVAASFGMACNGALQVFDGGVDVCAPFAKTCADQVEMLEQIEESPNQSQALPLAVPSNAPSDQPPDIEVDSPTLTTTPLVSTSPTNIPSITPSEATNQPSQTPSFLPSTSYNAGHPTESPSNSPSTIPSRKPVIAGDISSFLSASEPPTAPSQSPTHLTSTGALAASLVQRPSKQPTLQPSPMDTSRPTLPSTSVSTPAPSISTFLPTTQTISSPPTAAGSSEAPSWESPSPSQGPTLSTEAVLLSDMYAPNMPSTNPSHSNDVATLTLVETPIVELTQSPSTGVTSAPTAVPSWVPTFEGQPASASISSHSGTVSPTPQWADDGNPTEQPSHYTSLPQVFGQENEFSGLGACDPLVDIDSLSAEGSYSQGSLGDASDLSGLQRCGLLSTSTGGGGKLYRVVGSGTTLTVHTCSPFFQSSSFDTQLTVYTSDTVGNNPCAQDLICVGANDDFCGKHSLVNWFAEAGRIYFISVEAKPLGVASMQGLETHFSLTLAPTPGGSCEAALSIGPDPLTGEIELPLGGDPSGMDQMESVGFVWFAMVATDLSWLIVSACQEEGTFPAHMKVFEGSCDDGGLHQVETTESRCVSGQILTWLSEPRKRYYVKAYK